MTERTEMERAADDLDLELYTAAAKARRIHEATGRAEAKTARALIQQARGLIRTLMHPDDIEVTAG